MDGETRQRPRPRLHSERPMYGRPSAERMLELEEELRKIDRDLHAPRPLPPQEPPKRPAPFEHTPWAGGLMLD